MEPIKHLEIKKNEKISDLIENMSNCGFGARKVSEASEILTEMINDKECKIFFGLAGAMVPAGMKKIIIDILNHTDIFVSTGANLTHDLIEALGHKHYKGDEKANDKELNKKGIDRIYDVFMENKVYGDLEKFFDENFEELSKCKDIKNLLWKIGELLNVNENESILKKCFVKKIPIFCPALADSGIGLMIWGNKARGKKIFIDAFEDMKEIIDFSWKQKKKGVFYIGGGTPKNFIQQSMQFSTPASYGIQITTDRQESGGSSGALLKEGISWGKMSEKGKFTNVPCDATIALPLIWGYVKNELSQ
ncbi:MAG: deoxyhypusine synthase family protein [Nanoarchaeota archaeon]